MHYFTVIGAIAFSGASFGEGEGRILLVNVLCTGTERALMNCTANSSEAASCSHTQDAGVRCLPGNKVLRH